MRVAVIGGGNIGTLMAAEMAYNGHDVVVYTSNPDCWNKSVEVYDSDSNYLFSGEIGMVTSSLDKAIRKAEIIFVTLPSHMFVDIAEQMYPYVTSNQAIGIVPGSGGAEFAFGRLISKGCTFFGLQRVHSIARIKERGKAVYMLGKKDMLHIGAVPASCANKMAEAMVDLLKIKCVTLKNYLCITLTPSNPILHTTRLYSMFKDYRPETFYPRNFLFYEEWTDDSSEVLFLCDKELQMLCKVIPIDLTQVVSLPIYYESTTPQRLTKKIQSINAFKGLTSPMKAVDADKWVPDFSSRYFTSDFSYGLKIILDLCELFSVDAPNIRRVWEWYVSVRPELNDSGFKLGLNKDELLKLYADN